MHDSKNILITFALCILILVGSEYVLRLYRPAAPPPVVSSSVTQQALPAIPPSQEMPLTQADALQKTPRIDIRTPRVRGSLNLVGAFFDDLILEEYHETVSPQSPEITLLSPASTSHPYRAFFRWASPETGVRLPDAQTVWAADQATLTPETPVTLSWDNGQGLLFQYSIAVDQEYMFKVTQRVVNQSEKPLSLGVQGNITRGGTPPTSGFFILYEGPLGVFNGTLKEISYDTLKDQPRIEQPPSTGWLGMTDKYWLVALVPNQKTKMVGGFSYKSQPQGQPQASFYEVDFREEVQTLLPGKTIEATNYLFAGAKELRVLDGYEKSLGINHFDLAVDFGWFYFLTKPIFYALEWLKQLTGNFGLAILLLTVILKIFFFPLANKSYRSMARMKRLQPMMEQLRARFENDKQKLNEEMMALYRREKINPVSGCLPMLIQIPVFFALYKVLFITLEMRHAPFFGWIQDLSAPDPTTLFNLFGLIPWTPPPLLMVGLWPILMGATMFIQQKLNPPPADPIQEKMFLYVMPLVFTAMLAQFPAGLVIYWAWNNILSVGQQYLIMRQNNTPLPPLKKKR